MRRRDLLMRLGAIAAWAGIAAAQQRTAPRVGVLSPQQSNEPAEIQRAPFERGLREFGWNPGADVLIEYRYADGSAERLTALAAELARLKVDVIVARGPQATLAARHAASTIPIVMSATPDPVGSGLVTSLTRPGGNVTGLSFSAGGDLDGKRLELLKEAVPGLKRVAVLTNPLALQETTEQFAGQLAAAAPSLGLELQVVEVRSATDLPDAFAAILRANAEALFVRADPHVLDVHRAALSAFAREQRLPTIYPWRFSVEAGGLMSYGTSIPGLHHRSAAFVDKILKGAKPAELPVEQPTTFELVINLEAARAIGLDLPPALLDRADEVIE